MSMTAVVIGKIYAQEKCKPKKALKTTDLLTVNFMYGGVY
jgi:hypothetical protein